MCCCELLALVPPPPAPPPSLPSSQCRRHHQHDHFSPTTPLQLNSLARSLAHAQSVQLLFPRSLPSLTFERRWRVGEHRSPSTTAGSSSSSRQRRQETRRGASVDRPPSSAAEAAAAAQTFPYKSAPFFSVKFVPAARRTHHCPQL